MQALRFVTNASGHLFVRKNFNAPRPQGKSWSMIDRALQNSSQLFGEKRTDNTMADSSKRADRSKFFQTCLLPRSLFYGAALFRLSLADLAAEVCCAATASAPASITAHQRQRTIQLVL